MTLLMDALAQFCTAMACAGLPVPETVTADGALHRFSTNGDPRDESGWYVLRLDGIPSGAFGCERSGLPETWCARESSQMSDDDRHEVIRRMQHAQQQREADREQRQLAAAVTAARLWEAAQPAPAAHPYLVRKQIQPHGIRSDGDNLIIPMYDDGTGRLCSLQFIDGAGEKLFLAGGRAAGCYYPIDGDRATVYVAKGFATAASIAEASGAAVAVCFTADQILAVAQLMRGKFPAARLVIAADSDIRDDDPEDTSLEKATDAATLTEVWLAVPTLDGAKDFNDVHIARGLDEVRQQLARAALTERTLLGRQIRRYAELGPVRHDKERRAVAKKHGVVAGAIDNEIEQHRQRTTEQKELDEASKLFPPIEPYDGEVNGHQLVEAIRRQIRRFVVMDKHALTAAALWVIHTHAVDAASIAPILLVLSPVKRCGKSTLRDVLTPLVYRGLPVDNISTAVIYRAMESFHPTLMIDEADSFLDQNEEMRGVINAGHRRGAKTLRMGGVNRQIEVFDPFGPKLIAGIGRRRDTIEDRAIIVKLRRRKADESVEAARLDRLDNRPLQSFCAAWARDNLANLKAAEPPMPESLHDRAADSWRPLLAIADLCGVGAEAREAANTLTGEDTPTESAGVMLLADIRQIFADRDVDRISSAVLVDLLGGMEERPWPEWRNGKPITSRQLARLLEPFGVTPRTIRFDTSTAKGYLSAAFSDVFECYLVKTESGAGTTAQP